MKYALLLLALTLPFAASAQEGPQARAQHIAALEAEKTASENKVKAIVNQPITHLPRTSWSMVQIFSPGWFHAGAKTPDYEKVDVRKTRELPYITFDHVTSDVTPNEMFNGPELEFNPMTKFYYTDLKLPKKRLSEAEMVEINRLYRIIGSDIKQIAGLQNVPFTTSVWEFFNSFYGTLLQLLMLCIVTLVVYMKLFARRA